MTHFKDYKFIRSFSTKAERWPMKKAEQLWRRLRERKIAEIEAAEACKWLRAAGFPQYAQMYEDMQFPVDVASVAKDHPFLENDSLESLYRRLHALNRCASMRLDSMPAGVTDDSDEDDSCALSEHWTFQPESRRWSRLEDVCADQARRLQSLASAEASSGTSDPLDSDVDADPPSTEPVAIDALDVLDALEGGGVGDPPVVISAVRFGSLPFGGLGGPLLPDAEHLSRFRRTGSERLRDGAKALLRRMESLRTRRRKRQHREGVVIGSPQVLNMATMEQRMRDLNCVDVSPSADSEADEPSSPVVTVSSMSSSLQRPTKRLHSRDSLDSTSQSLSDSECPTTNWRKCYLKDANSNRTKVVQIETSGPPPSIQSASMPTRSRTSRSIRSHETLQSRSGSLNLGHDSQRFREMLTPNFRRGLSVDATSGTAREMTPAADPFEGRVPTAPSSFSQDDPRISTYDNVYHPQVSPTSPAIARSNASSSSERVAGDEPMMRSQASHDSTSTLASQGDSEREEGDESQRHRVPVVRWHSFQRSSSGRPESFSMPGQSPPNSPGEAPVEISCSAPLSTSTSTGRVHLSSLSCGQLLVLRKLALLKLTACMERYCPTHRTGWNWELPKFIRKIKAPDYKDKSVFGVPLLLSLQRRGQVLPAPLLKALQWLRVNAVDQVGLFRKPGVRSRIQKLKMAVETEGEEVEWDIHQAYDIADMVKQFFRELPEALLTNKLSETFIAIFQYVPASMRGEAVNSVILLLPDEHREALRVLLDFLHAISLHANVNQMSASNLAVCLAPSLLRLHHMPTNGGSPSARGPATSPRRRNKSGGAPDTREIGENKAAHDCVLHLIKCHRDLFTVTEEVLTLCHFTYMEESIPVALEELGTEMNQDWRGYLHACVNALLREARERSRGWVSVSGFQQVVDVAYRKVGDGHPLRLWRVWTQVEAPPREVLHRILRQRHFWDSSLVKWRVVSKLGEQAEVFQYVCADMAPLPNKDYCVVRSWRVDLPKGACVVVETSVEHSQAPVMAGGVRAVVLASRYLIEPCGSGRSRVMHLSRVDTKGRCPDWYNKSYGHLCAYLLAQLRNSFRHNTEGPESKV